MALRVTETYHNLSVHLLQYCWHIIQKNLEFKAVLEWTASRHNVGKN